MTNYDKSIDIFCQRIKNQTKMLDRDDLESDACVVDAHICTVTC